MKSIYTSPLRVFLCLALIAIAGIYQGFNLPVSLYPSASKPNIQVSLSYGGSTATEFLNTYGARLESRLHSLKEVGLAIDTLSASYEADRVYYSIKFQWGVSERVALREVGLSVNSFLATMPQEIRDSMWLWSNDSNGGFLAVSFFSDTRSLTETYDILEPILVPPLNAISDINVAELYNPQREQILIEMKPEVMASLGLVPRDVESAVRNALRSGGGGSLTVGTMQMSIQMPRNVQAVEDLKFITIRAPSGRFVTLNDVATVDMRIPMTGVRSFKTSGAPSVILWAEPRPDGNVKNMAEDIIHSIEQRMVQVPKDIHYKVLVDPSTFIRSAVKNVFIEVLLAAFLAVSILFIFIGSLRNTITAAIEIPLSIVMAFIMMKLAGMNLNLISLGGLALSAGMNVDASVVVMENIFRHFKSKTGTLDLETRLHILMVAVREVRMPVIASTVASLVVFVPLAFTSNLTSSILGDLAKAVVFSHAFSAVIALILVPTIRLLLMKSESNRELVSPIQPLLTRLEDMYAHSLQWMIEHRAAQAALYICLPLVLAALVVLALPKIPKEIMGLPDTDFINLTINTEGNSLLQQMESEAAQIEARLLEKHGKSISYTFTQIHNPNRATVMARLNDKGEMNVLWRQIESEFENTPFVKFFVKPWNPSELPIPDEAPLHVSIRGANAEERARVGRDLQNALEEKHTKLRIWTEPEVASQKNIVVRPYTDQQMAFQPNFSFADIADIARVATAGRQIGEMPYKEQTLKIDLRYKIAPMKEVEELMAFPVGVNGKLVPLKAFGRVQIEDAPATLYRENEREIVSLYGKTKKGDEAGKTELTSEASQVVRDWQKNYNGPAQIVIEESEKDLNDAIRQLLWAVGLSILLIFVTMVMEFGTIVAPLLVLVAIPVGIIGVIASLSIFQSSLSLNSVLGVILMNGLAVANSILLVDFIRRLVEQGITPAEAAIQAARKRLKPILITSLTTIVGMLPVAIGHGEGGRILQPLGIAVTGGLWFSTLMTLYLVPLLQTSYLNWRGRSVKLKEAQKIYSLRA